MRQVLERLFDAGAAAGGGGELLTGDFEAAKRKAIEEAMRQLGGDELEPDPGHEEVGAGRCLVHGAFASADGDCPECRAAPA